MQLRSHQVVGADWLSENPHGYLGDAPRVGKTFTLLSALEKVESKHPLIVVPAIVRTHWTRKAQEFGGAVPIIRSYDEIRSGGVALREELFDRGVDAIVMDEAHYLKNHKALRTKMIYGKEGYARFLDIVWPASGTPFSKNPGELWTFLAALHPQEMRKLGFRSQPDFEREFAIMKFVGVIRGEPRFKAMGIRNPEGLKELLKPLMLRRTLADLGRDTPALDWQVVEINGDKLDPDTKIAATKIDVTDLSLARVANDGETSRIRHEIGRAKVRAVTQMLVELLEDKEEPVVVFAYHHDVLDMLYNNLTAANVSVTRPVTGKMNDAQKATMIDAFQAGQYQVYLGQTNANQVGIQLDRASTAFLVEPDWTADVNLQAGMRIVDADRPDRKCVVQMLALANTMDEAIVRQNQREVKMQEAVF